MGFAGKFHQFVSHCCRSFPVSLSTRVEGDILDWDWKKLHTDEELSC